jgi:hypothetical protein
LLEDILKHNPTALQVTLRKVWVFLGAGLEPTRCEINPISLQTYINFRNSITLLHSLLTIHDAEQQKRSQDFHFNRFLF